MTKNQTATDQARRSLLAQIRVLQGTRDYADEIEAERLSRIIERKLAELDQISTDRPARQMTKYTVVWGSGDAGADGIFHAQKPHTQVVGPYQLQKMGLDSAIIATWSDEAIARLVERAQHTRR